MEKKKYIVPQSQPISVDLDTHVLAGSITGNVGEKPGIGWGGVDEEGTIDPQSRKFEYNPWTSPFE